MGPFEELTPAGRTRRLRPLVREVLRHGYGLADPRVRLLSRHSFNSVFRVDADGGRFVLRVGDVHRIHVLGVEDIEAGWLAHLDRTSTIGAPRPVPTSTGRWWVEHEVDGVPVRRTCSLFTFLEGRELRAHPSFGPDAVHSAGEVLARLHEHAATDPPAIEVPPRLRADRAVYFHDVDLVRTHQSKQRKLFIEAIDRVQRTLDDLWASPPHRPHLLHGDFGPHNLLTSRGQLRPIDFQDLLFGFDLQDLALSLADLARRTPNLSEHFLAGYRNVRAVPDLTPELSAVFAAQRDLNLMNLGLHLGHGGLAEGFDDHARRVADWMHN